MPLYTRDPHPFDNHQGSPLFSSIGIGPHVTKAIDKSTRQWLEDHPEATTTVEDDSITTPKLQDGSITTDKIATDGVRTSNIEDGSVTTPKIADLAVTTPKIANAAVTAQKLASDAIDAMPTMSATQRGVAKVGPGLAITNQGALELDGDGDIATAIDSWLDAHPEATTTVQDGAVTTAKIADGAVTDTKLAQSYVNETKILYDDNYSLELKNPTWEQGGRSTTGQKIDRNYRVRYSSWVNNPTHSYLFEVGNGYEMMIMESSNGVVTAISEWRRGTFIVTSTGSFTMIVSKQNAEDMISVTPEEVEANVTMWQYIPKIDVLESEIDDVSSDLQKLIATEYAHDIKDVIGIGMARGGISRDTGANLNFNTYPDSCKTTFIPFDSPLLISCGDYHWTLWSYSEADKNAGVSLLGTYDSKTMPLFIVPSDNEKYVRIGFRGVAEEVTDTELAEVRDSIVIAVMTDPTFTKIGIPADAKHTGDRLDTLENNLGRSNGKKYDFKNYLSASAGAPTTVSSMTVIDGMLFVFEYAVGDAESNGCIFYINEDGTLTNSGNTFESNIGHQNCLDYCPETKCLIAGRSTTDTRLYILEGIDGNTRDFDVSNAVSYDLLNDEDYLGQAVNPIWAYSNRGAYDMAYVITYSPDKGTRYIYLLQFAKGSNVFEKGTFIPGVDATHFNGTYQIVKVVSNETSAEGGITDRSNDACYFDGKIYEIPAPTRTSGLALMIHSLENFGSTLKTEKLYFEERYSNGLIIGGDNTGVEHEGLAIYNGCLYTGRHHGGIETYRF